jgi:pimeloyl-ACP methyl ester carboxylesterase
MSPVAPNGELSIVYATHGDPTDPALLLVSGYTRQLIGWPVEFIDGLVSGGRFVIVYDNRDCGESSKLADRTVNLPELLRAAGAADWTRAREHAAYTLSDMGGDGLAVLDALDIERAHVLGVSMGGMIAQTIAIEHPDRVLSLVSIMSRTGEPLAIIAPNWRA